MAEKNFLTMSENGKSEYCCSVVKISELIPIEGSDFLAMTNVLGTQIVDVRIWLKKGISCSMPQMRQHLIRGSFPLITYTKLVVDP